LRWSRLTLVLVLGSLAAASCGGSEPERDLFHPAYAFAERTADAYAQHLDELLSLRVTGALRPPEVTWEPAPCPPPALLCKTLQAARRDTFRATHCLGITEVAITYLGEDPEVPFDFAARALSDRYRDPDYAPAEVAYTMVPVPPEVVERHPLLTDDGKFVDLDRVFVIAWLIQCQD
jgi:hypothetical protein